MQFNRTRRAALALALVSLAACGGTTDPKEALADGNRALASNDYVKAATSYETALSSATGPQIVQAKIGLAKAAAGINPNTAKEHLMDLLAKHGDAVDDKVLFEVADRLRQNKHYDQATDILAKGKEKFPDSESLDKLGNKLATEAAATGDPAQLERLKGLGYLGD